MNAGPAASLTDTGSGPPLVFLHGWGSESSVFAGLVADLGNRHRCIRIDLPGFGKTPPPPAPWSSGEYAEWLRGLLESIGVNQPVLLGHSFGGKVAARLAAWGLARKLVLLGSAGIPPKRPPSYYAKVYTYKTVKLLAKVPVFGPLFRDIQERMSGRAGSADYRAAQGVMRASLVRSVNEDLRPVFAQVPCPTLLVWGRNDTATPVADAQTIEKLIPGSGLVVLDNAAHYVFTDQAAACAKILAAFLEDVHA